MDITLQPGDVFAANAALVAVGAWEGEELPGALRELIAAEDWQGKAGQSALLYTRGALPAPRVLLLGLGKRGDASSERVRAAAALATQKARSLKLSSFAIAPLGADALGASGAGQALAEGAVLGAYRFIEYKSDSGDDEAAEVTTISVVAEDAGLAEGLRAGAAIARGQNFARDLANRPGNALTPRVLGEVALALAERHGLGVTVFDKAQLVEQGFGGLLAVAQGSAEEPRFIVLEHGKAEEGRPTVCLVGKGITFDTGGISIKPAGGMEDMKFDMGGAAAVLGAMQAVAELALPLHVVGIVSSAENMPSGTAFKPGDIIKTLSGKQVEINNTDAEGRVVLSDALYYAQRYSPAAIIDLATLTGACVVALGHAAAGLMGNNQPLAERLMRAGEVSGERVWQLPLYDDYKEAIKSVYADIKNSAGREAGAQTGGAFLSHFVGDYPWAHLDIAGTASAGSGPSKPYQPKGATGYGVRLLLAALRGWDAQGS
jgi:leucyl aminopeptidase